MDVSTTSSSTTTADIQTEVQKKAQDVQTEQIQKVLESASEQAKDENIAKKTGIGSQLNIAG